MGYNMIILLTLLAVFFLYCLQALYYKKYWIRGLDCKVCFQDRAVNEGDMSALQETILNRKIFPLVTLQVKFSVSRTLQFTEAENTATTDNNYRNDIFSVMSYEKISRVLPFRAAKRGCYRVWNLDLISFDLFLSNKSVVSQDVDTTLYVYPKPVPFAELKTPFRQMMGTILTKRSAFEDPFEFRGIRPYQQFDPMKNVNWKASAKSGEWMVNVHDYTASQRVTIFLNLADDSIWHYDRLFESSIRLAASYAEFLVSQGIPVQLISNGVDALTGQPLMLPAGAGTHHIRSVKEGLARLSDRSQDLSDLEPLVAEKLISSQDSELYLLISSSQKKHLLGIFDRLCQKSEGSQWIAPLHKDMDFLPERCPHAASIRWEVSRIE
ncbi:DUF58 domain-containing protein [Sellimonas intestinalis]|uniref:DUF58 domain-containing protein n=1 Tax=Sellimonas intestinalis TaxID=1653434 RepID=UPI0015EC92F3|nr:DUF58 domain-containing protein [Sellimonas intestinalis]MBA2213678.1 DUF58 domain-containing protein [Sellimonas intestinalis]